MLSAEGKEEARMRIQEGLARVVGGSAGARKVVEKGSVGVGVMRREEGREGGEGFAVVIDGETLRYALEEDLKSLFLNLATRCETVVCCRVSPAQKAQTVKLVRLSFPHHRSPSPTN